MLLEPTPNGLFCQAGGFYLDPFRPVGEAVITHAHGDHARPGSAHYLATPESLAILRHRLSPEVSLQSLPYGEVLNINGVKLSFHPAGHMLGSAQVRLEHRGEVWVVTGDFKRASDPTCRLFEPIRCHVLISECTFGLPIFTWPPASQVIKEILAWWAENAEKDRGSLLLAYTVGKAQRLLAELSAQQTTLPGPILAHGAIVQACEAYRTGGVALPVIQNPLEIANKREYRRALILAPPSALATAWTRRFFPFASAMASGWMRIRGLRRRRALDRGFVLSDHADWPGLLDSVRESGAERVYLMHGSADALVRYLQETGLDAHTLEFPGAVWSSEGED
jgi:putative mRNA 3-end processing factor